ncbi:MAG TPA: DedA family protein [Bacteroidota bacterium]|nr:DedA family protein [Bacteroidota bacterium]
METLSAWIAQYGYFGLFTLLMLGIIGLPVPDETLLTFSGYLASVHRLTLPWTLAASIAGSICGITISFFLGRSLGLYLLLHYGKYVFVTPEKLDRVHAWFRKRGKWTLFVGYFIPGVRHLTAYTAGASKLEFPLFMLFAYTGGLVWSVCFVILGYSVGIHWHKVVEHLQKNILVGSILLVVLAAGFWLLRRRTAKQ